MVASPASILSDMRMSGISILSLLIFALSNYREYIDLLDAGDIGPIFDLISTIFAVAADAWAVGRATAVFRAEMGHLTGPKFGLRANASHLVSDQISTFSIPALRNKMSKGVPRLWNLMISLLGTPADDNEELPEEPPKARRERLTVVKAVQILSTIAQHNNQLCNLMQVALSFFMAAKQAPAAVFEVYAHAGLAVSDATRKRMLESARKEHEEKLLKEGKTWLASLAWDNLDFSLSVTQSTQDNQAQFESITTGLIFQLEHGVTPEDLKRPRITPPTAEYPNQRVPNRWKTPDLSKEDVMPPPESRGRVMEAMLWVIREILVNECAPELRSELGDIPSMLRIPVKKTSHRPIVAVREKSSSNDGNINVLLSWMKQTGMTDEMTRHVVAIVHGDLGVIERLKSVLKSRSIERTDRESFEYVETVPGLFHVLMACADAIWRTYIQPKEQHEDPRGVFRQFLALNPAGLAKLKSNPPFRMLHNGIGHVLTARILECARILLNLESIEKVKESAFTWAKIVELAQTIYRDNVEGGSRTGELGDDGFQALSAKEKAQKNRRLFNRDAIWYQVLARSMKLGAIGMVEDILHYWAVIFKATHKHKYAAHMMEFLTRLRILPERLSRAIRLNWLCNPTGQRDGFRAIDWIVELNNLYVKAVYAGSGPNRTIDHIIEQSGLIELYRSCHENIEDNFEISSRTVHHAAANMDADIGQLARGLRYRESEAGAHTGVVEVKDQLVEGSSLLLKGLYLKRGQMVEGDREDEENENEEAYEVEEADLGI